MLRQLIPETATVEIGELLSSLQLAGRASAELPYTIVNFIASADGRAAFHGRSGAFGDEADKAMFHGLREQVDAVIAGTRTLRVERYGRVLGKPERRRRRVEAGRASEPLACVLTRTGDVPTEAPIFAEPESRIIVFSPGDLDTDGLDAQVELVRLDPGEMTLTTVLRRLRSDYDVRSLLCEGGPTIFGALLSEGLANELFLTLSPKLVGGGSEPPISNGPELPELCELSLAWALERDSALYLRYTIGRSAPAED